MIVLALIATISLYAGFEALGGIKDIADSGK